MNIIDRLECRDAFNQQTDAEELHKLVEEKKISLYCGVDPTGDSMHSGYFLEKMDSHFSISFNSI
jgi:tyrosyl-tRNA synthetase